MRSYLMPLILQVRQKKLEKEKPSLLTKYSDSSTKYTADRYVQP